VQNQYAIYSDFHLGIHKNNPLWHKIALDWTDWFISQLKEKNISKIIFLGDFFHNRSDISVDTLHVASIIAEKFKDFEVLMLVGNHCSFYKDRADIHSLSFFKGHPNVKVIDKAQTIHIGDKDVFFAPWGTMLKDIPNSDVLMGHFEIESFKFSPHKVCEKGISPSALCKKAPLIFSGHFHLRSERDYKKSKIIYVGNPFEMYFDDVEETKGYYVINFDDLNYKFYENEFSPKHKKIKISDLKNTKNVKNNIIKVIVDKNLNDVELEKYIEEIKTSNPLFFSLDTVTSFNPTIENLDEEYDLSGIDIEQAISEFVQSLDFDNKEEVVKQAINYYRKL
jgi:DNA repair exonuclease SbcCD nuclease subunit